MTVSNANNYYLAPVIAIPSSLEITAISKAFPMVISTTMNSDQVNTYIPGQLVKLMIPQTYGMWQANGLVGMITDVTGSNITVNIDSSGFDSFVVPASSAEQPASLSPSGSRNLAYSNSTTQIAFQSLNDRGN
jgi:hypothetical protein